MKTQLLLSLLWFHAFGLAAGGRELELLVHSKTIPLETVEGRIDHMAVDVAGQRLFVSALGNNTVEVVDLKAGKRIQSLSGFAEPQGMVFVPEFNKLFVANGKDGTVRILDGRSFKTLDTTQVGDDADNVRYEEAGKKVYVGFGGGALGVIDPNTGAKIGEINLAGHPESFRLETRGPRIFVNVPQSRQIAVANRENKTVEVIWPVEEAKSNFPMSLDEARHRLFAGCRDPAKVLVYDSNSGRLVACIPISGDADDLFYDAEHEVIYASCGSGVIDIIQQNDANSYTKLDAITTAPGARTSLFVPELKVFCLAVPHRGQQGAEIRVYKTK